MDISRHRVHPNEADGAIAQWTRRRHAERLLKPLFPGMGRTCLHVIPSRLRCPYICSMGRYRFPGGSSPPCRDDPIEPPFSADGGSGHAYVKQRHGHVVLQLLASAIGRTPDIQSPIRLPDEDGQSAFRGFDDRGTPVPSARPRCLRRRSSASCSPCVWRMEREDARRGACSRPARDCNRATKDLCRGSHWR